MRFWMMHDRTLNRRMRGGQGRGRRLRHVRGQGFGSERRWLLHLGLIGPFSLDQNASFVGPGFLRGSWMGAGAFGGDVMVRASIGIPMSITAPRVAFVSFRGGLTRFVLGTELLQSFLHGIRLQSTAVGSDRNSQSLEFRDQIPVLHP